MGEKDLDELQDIVCEYVTDEENVSFIKLEMFLDQYIEVEGSYDFHTSEDENVYLWFGMSELFCKIVANLLVEERLYIHPAHPSIYVSEGKYPTDMELAGPPPEGGHNSPKWYPATLSAFPPR